MQTQSLDSIIQNRQGRYGRRDFLASEELGLGYGIGDVPAVVARLAIAVVDLQAEVAALKRRLDSKPTRRARVR